jgi:hypothetical protein
MIAITLHQPWATLVAIGAKEYETRSWATRYRGQIAIHAGKYKCRDYGKLLWQDPFKSVLKKAGFDYYDALPFGMVIAVADLTAIYDGEMLAPKLAAMGRDQELIFGSYGPGRYAWRLENVKRIAPRPARGGHKLWTWHAAL